MTRHFWMGAASAAALLVSMAANAQEAEVETLAEEASAEADTDDIITITGSRIQGVNTDGAVQAVVFDRDAIAESGADSLIELLRDSPLTAGGAGTFSTSTGGPLSSDTPVGSAGVSLRGLGTSATLTLINGRRASVSAFANGQESFIDVNSIPLAAVERVEVLPNGASALYGADAVAGVVNYVLRDDYEGAEISVGYGNSTRETDEGRFNISAVAGRRFGDRNHVMAVLDYYKRNALFDRDRESTRDSFRPSQQGFYPSFNDLGLQLDDQTEEPQDGGCAEDDFGVGNFGDFCAVDTNDFVSTLDELESAGGLLTHNFEINDRVTWFNEVLAQWSVSQGTGSPANFSRAPGDPENPFLPDTLADDLLQEGIRYQSSLDPDDRNFIFVPEDFSDFSGFPLYSWGKYTEPRAVEVESLSYRLTTGVKADLGESWFVEAALLYGGNDRTQRGLSGLVNSQAFYDANLGNLCTDGSRVERWEVDAERPDAFFIGETCEDQGKTTLWYNPFGGQTQQSEGIEEAITTTAEREGESRMTMVDVSATGDLFMLNGFVVKAALGAEFRREEVTDTPSEEAVATEDNPNPILGFSSTSVDAERDQYALFGELYVPLADNFELQLAGRYDEYDDFGGDFNPKVAFRYAPLEQLIVRGNWSTSFRAPSLAQSGAGVLLSSYTVDCEDTPEACNGDDDADGESLLSEDVGNPDLDPESAETWGVGALIRPTESIELSVDYWNIRHEDLVGVDEDDFIRRAFAGEFAVVGEGQLATGQAGLEVSNGFVVDAHFALQNLGYQETSGFDVSYTQYFDFGALGELSLLADATYLLEFERQASPSSPVEDLAGDYRYPELLVNAGVRWRADRWGAAVFADYTSAYDDDPSPSTLDALGIDEDADIEVADWLIWDVNLNYDLTERTFVSLNVENVFDQDPPRVLGSSANVDHINHNSLGRFVRLRVTQEF